MKPRSSRRYQILALVRDMAVEFPHTDFGYAREQFGLLGKVKVICNNEAPTARECWESVGLQRSHLVDKFEFTQIDRTCVTLPIDLKKPFRNQHPTGAN